MLDHDHPAPQGHFVTTHWSVVLAAREKDAPGFEAALELLCQTYWYPIYAYIRKSGHSPHDAQDLTQEFFARLLNRDWLRLVEPEKGPFRAFLFSAVKRFLANEWHRASALKRGGGKALVELDLAENRFAVEPPLSPDELYERRWAMTLIEEALEELRREFHAAGKATEFELLKPCLTAPKSDNPSAEVAGQLGMTEGALRVATHRLRKRFRQLFREQISQTVGTTAEVDDELRHLLNILGRS